MSAPSKKTCESLCVCLVGKRLGMITFIRHRKVGGGKLSLMVGLLIGHLFTNISFKSNMHKS